MQTLIRAFLAVTFLVCAAQNEALAQTGYPKVSDLGGETVFSGMAGAGIPYVALPQTPGKVPGVFVEYSPATKPVLKKLRRRFMEHKVLERMFAGVDDVFKYKHATTFQMAECGYTGAFQSKSERRMVICYEFVLVLKIAFEKSGTPVNALDKAVFHAFTGVAWHEFGHFLMSEFDILVTGSAEDAVDQLAAIVQIARDPDEAALAVNQGRALVALQSKKFGAYMRSLIKVSGSAPPPKARKRVRKIESYMSSHGSGKRRLHNLLCLVYGSNPSKLKGLVGPQGLHPQRAQSCEKEFKRVSGAWARLLRPHARSPRDISARRCGGAFEKMKSLMIAAKAPAKALAAVRAQRQNIVSGCIKEHLARPVAMGKWSTCIRVADSYQEAKGCPKAVVP